MTIFVQSIINMQHNIPYSLKKIERLVTRTVRVGNLVVGSDAPVSVQSMCNTPTDNVEESVKQAIQIIEAGGQLVRYTVRHQSDVKALQQIHDSLKSQGFNIPLVADIHFNAQLAIDSALIVEKVRINPGNFIHKRAHFSAVQYSDKEWNDELLKVENKLLELIEVCKLHHTTLRIGINHGSLSDRIMSRFGNTIEGMTESAMEFLRICKNHNFNDVIVSIKSSNVRIMVQAYRRLVQIMQSEAMNYPLHLGVTEAGNGLEGRIKSAAGIGALLSDGLGDTIRVSLTEPPENEIPVAQQLVAHIRSRMSAEVILPDGLAYNPFEYEKRTVQSACSINLQVPAVVLDLRTEAVITESIFKKAGYKKQGDGWAKTNRAAEYLFVKTTKIETPIPENVKLLFEADETDKPLLDAIPVLTRAQYIQLHKLLRLKEKWVYLRNPELVDEMVEILRKDEHVVIILETTHGNAVADQRAFFIRMVANGLNHPVVVKRNFIDEASDLMAVKAAADVAPLFIDGFGEGIWLTNPFMTEAAALHEISFGVLQAARVRSTTTDFIACPSCGRTQFNIEKVLDEVKAHTSHLHHLKIAVMGCIVNGPGEMADADYGYIGAASDKVMLYKGKNAVKKNIPTANAVHELVLLIKENGDWIEP